MARRSPLRWLLTFLVLCLTAVAFAVACSEGEPLAEDDDAPDASASTLSAVTPVSLGLAEALAGTDATLARRLRPQPDGWQRGAEGITSPGWRLAAREPALLVAALLPERADGTLRVGLGRGELLQLGLTARGAGAVPVMLSQGRALYPSAWRSVDLIVVSEPTRLEWLYLLHDAGAPVRFEVGVTLPPTIVGARPTEGGGFELVDEFNAARFVVPPAFAVDAAGVRRAVTLTWDRGALAAQLDPIGLEYPVLIDPAIETPVWERRQAPPEPRLYSGLAYDAVRQKVVLFGGLLGSAGMGDTWEYGTEGWRLRSVTGPSPRHSMGMVYNTQRQRVQVFGGFASGFGYLSDLWEWDGTAWTELCTAAACAATRPPGRSSAAVVWDLDRTRLVVFGGSSGASYFDDTWEWNGAAWQQLCTTAPCSSTKPSMRTPAAYFYDDVGNTTLLFGGQQNSTLYSDTWRWNGTAWTSLAVTGPGPTASGAGAWQSTWNVGLMLANGGTFEWSGSAWAGLGASLGGDRMTHAPPLAVTVAFGGSSETYLWNDTSWAAQTQYPAPRTGHALAADASRSRIVMYGGENNARDTWEWTGLTWVRACTSVACQASRPPAASGHQLVFDPNRNRSVLFGGVDTGNVYQSQLWEWDGTAWTQQCSACSAPPARRFHGQAYHTATSRVYVFGGESSTGTALDDLWAYSATGSAWTQLCGACAFKPSGRQLAGMTYDKARNRIVLFGGRDGTGARLGDTWEFAGGVWTRPATTGPVAREGAMLSYDEARGRVTLFGGYAGGFSAQDDTWEWDGTTWTQLSSTTGSPNRRSTAGAYDATRRRLVIFGGFGIDSAIGMTWADTWEYYTRGGGCGSSSSCDTGYCTDGVCCESFSCGTCEACNTTADPGRCAAVVRAGSVDVTDTDSCTGNFSCSALGDCLKKDGQVCAAAAECASGACVDGYCCNSACTGGCERCDATPGTCTVRASGTPGECGALLCKGATTCPATCATNADCLTGYYCGADLQCHAKIAAAQTCNASDCSVAGCDVCLGTNKCADGVCCDTVCTGSCRACNVSPTVGTCVDLNGVDDPDSCGTTSTCVAGACKKKNGEVCTLGTECASTFCTDGYCCDAQCNGGCNRCDRAGLLGDCGPVAAGSAGVNPVCSPYVCNGVNGACPTSCTTDLDCAAGTYCSAARVCVTKKAQGASCNVAAGADCNTAGCAVCGSAGGCVDGFCCNAACSGNCDACNGGALGWSGATNGTCANAPVDWQVAACQPFSCPGASASCAATCTNDNQCAAGFYCNAANTCVAQKTQGSACNNATDCRSGSTSCTVCQTGNCVDGVCCNSTCSGACEACNVTLGQCTPSSAGSAGAPTCSPYLCNGTAGVCPTTCTSDTQCASTHYCAAGACVTKLAQGTSCTAGSQCSSGNCVDGYCCNSACNTRCRSCAGVRTGGANGTCADIIGGTDPDAECAADAVSTCDQDGECDGAGACRIYASGTTCGASTCSGTTQTNQVCTGAGSCVSSGVACTPGYGCSGTACTVLCNSDSECATGYFCQSSDRTCRAKLANGTACTASSQCSSTNCVDGFCCDAPCGGTCFACSAALKGSGANGVCGFIAINTDPGNECTAGTGCGLTGNCDGAGACRFQPAGTSCGSNSCSNALQTGQQCNGSGGCVPAVSTPCTTGYLCADTSVCATSCTSDSQCVGTYYCRASDSRCQPDQANGAACTAPSQCQSNNCVDGFCCDAPCGGGCMACSAAKTDAADGVCAPVSAGTDPESECTAAAQSTCQEDGSCDGAGACRKWAFGTSCGTSTCATGLQVGQVCNGTGTCVAGGSTQCAPFECANSSVCATSCTTDSQCVGAYYCRTSDGTCQPDLTQGQACTRAAQCGNGNCVDGYCCDGTCLGTCQACSAALKGSGANGVCGAIAVGTDPGNECPTEAASGCGRTGTCDGSGACALYAPGTQCGVTSCASGTQTGNACDGFGVCQPSSQTACAPYFCRDAQTCASSCSADSDCVAQYYCDSGSGTCRADLTNGAACARASQCLSGFCTDGVCCAQDCTGACVACSAALKGSGADGACGPIANGTDPQNECTDEGPSSCRNDGFCNGFGACGQYDAGTVCGTTSCAPGASGGTQTGYACNGAGSCVAAATTPCAPYVCGATACKVTCADDADCVSTHHCNLGTGRCDVDVGPGQACDRATQCQSGYCVDGVCCDSPCSGTCEGCTGSRTGLSDGTCGDVQSGSDPDDECADDGAGSCNKNGLCNGAGACALYAAGTACGSTTCTADATGGSQTGYACDGLGACQPGQSARCEPYVCQGSACGAVCASDSGCIATAYCAAGACRPDQANGASCTAGSQCLSGHCVDGVCCDQACGGTCQACTASRKGAGNDGECGPVTAGQDPDSECAQQSPSTCGTDGSCDGAGACRRHAPGTSCGTNTCGGPTGGTLTGQQCDGFGTCVSGLSTQCDPYLCAGGACVTACGDDAQCVATAYCGSDLGCHPKENNGAACTGGNQCRSGFCVEGVCCDSACNSRCQACTAAGKESGADGVCGFAKAGVDPHGDCDTTDVNQCGTDGTCDGQGSCAFYAAGTVCGAVTCQGGDQVGFACTGTGSCDPSATTDCGDFACSVDRCVSTCAADGDCATTAYCDVTTSTCVPRLTNGETCSAGNLCQSGYCVDGVCCDTACDGQCQACDLPVALGQCSPVQGAPHGARPACDTGGADVCAGRTCDGAIDVRSCQGYVGSEVSCRDRSCTGGIESFSATCNGRGQCSEAADGLSTRPCFPFVCGADACLTACTTPADCEGANADCVGGQCVSGNTCADETTVQEFNGNTRDCRPYLCAAGDCLGACSTSSECAPGFVCDTNQGQGVCVAPTARAAAAEDGGCGCRAAPAPRLEGWGALLAAAVLAAARRRRGAVRRGAHSAG